MWEPTSKEREFVARGNIKLCIYHAKPVPLVSLEVVNEGMGHW